MIGRSTCHNINLADIADIFICETYFFQIDPAIFQNRIQSICYCLGLFMDLFDHKMFKAGFFCCFCIPVYHFHLFLDLFSIKIIECDLSFTDTCHFQIANIINISCILQNGRYIRSYIAVSFCNTQNHGAVFPGYINLSRIIMKHNSQCIGTANTYHCMIDGIYRCPFIFLVIIIYKLYCNFCICFRIEAVSLTKKFVFQFLVILNDTIVNSYYVPIITYMRMSVILRWLSMSGPSGMTNSAGACYRLSVVCLFCKDLQTSFGFDHFCSTISVTNCNPG